MNRSRPPRTGRSTVLLAGLVAALATVAGCATTGTAGPAPAGPAGPTGPTTAAAPSSQGLVPSVVVPSVEVPGLDGSSSATPEPGTAARVLPEGFPLPPGATVSGGTDDGSEVTARVALVDGAAAVRFWRQALPAAGYEVASVQGAAGFTEIRISGRGLSSDDSQIVVSGSGAEVQLDRG